jgi:hypothetical protein
MRADAIAEARAPAGLVVLQGEDREHPWFDAEALVWTGSTSGLSGVRGELAGDVLVLTLRLREPHGYGEIRGGRFVFATGAIRPQQVDGISAVGRLPSGLAIEAVSGFTVAPRFGGHEADWLTAGRLSQKLGSRVTAGASYARQNSREGVSSEEVGADMAAIPCAWLDIAGRAAYDMPSSGFADALVSAAARFDLFRVELFGTHRSPSRLLPATSLFSVLGDFPSDTAGTTLRWEAAPRLDLLASVAGQDVGGDLGGYAWMRSTLRLDDRGDGSLGLEVRRQQVSTVRWSGVRAVLAEPLGAHLRASSELELAWADNPAGRGSAWPWGLLAMAWRSGSGWEAAAAVEAGSTPQYRFEVNGLLRVSHTLEVR